MVLDLDLSDSCSIGGTWEELLSESFFDKITDGSVEIAGGRVLIGYFGIKLFFIFVKISNKIKYTKMLFSSK